MRGLSSTVLAAALLAVGPCADALAADTVEDIHRQCGEEYADPIAVAKCLTAEEKDYGKRLAATYQKVVELQTPDAKQVLIEAQRSWLKYQEKNCEFHERVLSFEGSENGKAAAALCELRTTMQRLAELEALLPNLEN
jgi:uncharacterized protein YecT (DUF1311 family)